MLAENEILSNHAWFCSGCPPAAEEEGVPALQLTVVIENRLQKAAILFRLRVIRNKPA